MHFEVLVEDYSGKKMLEILIPKIIGREDTIGSYAFSGTRELLADAAYPGGAAALKQKGYQTVGAEKIRWAEEISPHMNVDENASPSFNYFRDALRSLARGKIGQ